MADTMNGYSTSDIGAHQPRAGPSKGGYHAAEDGEHASSLHDDMDTEQSPTAEDMFVEEELVHDARRFEDFETIDWIQDTLFERARRLREARAAQRRNDTVSKHSSYFSRSSLAARFNGAQIRVWYLNALHATQSWLVVTLVGAGIGLNAALIDVVTSWLTDIKFGVCKGSWWLNSKFCCWEIDPVAGEDGESACLDWRNWSEVFFGLGYLVYVGYAVVFAFSAAYLVRQYAPYAAGSGISEIKCILAGFIMKGFLGLVTLIIKSLTLVRAHPRLHLFAECGRDRKKARAVIQLRRVLCFLLGYPYSPWR